MKYFVYPIILLFSCTSPKSKEEKGYGSLSVNIFWKYNNFVGNRPDAGSKAQLFSLTDSTISFKSTADVRGDIKFDSVPVDYYLLIIESKNTTDEALSFFKMMYPYKGLLDKICHCGIETILTEERINKLFKYDSLSSASLRIDNPSKALEQHQRYKDSAIKLAAKYFEEVPYDLYQKTGILTMSYPKKTDIRTISIRNGRDENVVVDFGITYF